MAGGVGAIELDIGKSTFHIHGAHQQGPEVLHKRSRALARSPEVRVSSDNKQSEVDARVFPGIALDQYSSC